MVRFFIKKCIELIITRGDNLDIERDSKIIEYD